jgi:hypothetical protein
VRFDARYACCSTHLAHHSAAPAYWEANGTVPFPLPCARYSAVRRVRYAPRDPTSSQIVASPRASLPPRSPRSSRASSPPWSSTPQPAPAPGEERLNAATHAWRRGAQEAQPSRHGEGPSPHRLAPRHRPRAEIRRRRCSSRCGRGRGRLASSRDPPVLLPLRPRSRPPRLEPNRAQGSRPRAVIWIRPPPPLVGRERVADDCCRDGRKWRSGEGVSGSPAAPRGVGWPEEAWERKWESGGG